MTRFLLLLPLLACFASAPASASDARLSYRTEDGVTHSTVLVSSVCGVDGNGVPQICPSSSGASSSIQPALVVNGSAITSQGSWPMSDPLVAGQAWSNHGFLMLSTGTAAAPAFDGSNLTVTESGKSLSLASVVASLPGYAPLASPALTGTPTAPTPATTDNSQQIATTAYVNNAFSAVEYSVQGDISTAGSSISIPFGSTGLVATFAYTASGSASMTFYAPGGTLNSVDIRRNTVWGLSAAEGFTLDNGSVGPSGVVADPTVYTASQDSSAYFIRVGGQIYFLTVWASNNGSRAFMGVHKMI